MPSPAPAPRRGDRPPEAGDPLTATLRELWCGVLGVSSAAPADDFYALGGESLALVHLLGRVREQTGVAVATAELAVAPTFGSLVDLVRRAAAQPPAPAPAGSPNLLPLHEAGEHDPDWRPLFLAAPGAGSTLCYRRLAPLVGDRRHPVYGLESPGLHDGAEPLRRFEEMARENLRLVREVQPRGPYRLGGWSVGAMVAHEMAAQLTAAGERVEPLLCIDGFVPRTRGRPIGARPGYLARGMWYQAQTALPFVRARNLGAALGLAGLTGDNGFTGDGRPTDGGAPGGDRRITDLGAQFVRVYQANVRAMLRYVPAPVDCAAVIFKTGLTGRTRRRVQREASASYRRGVRVVGVPGDHWSVLDRRFVADLATQIRAVLEP